MMTVREEIVTMSEESEERVEWIPRTLVINRVQVTVWTAYVLEKRAIDHQSALESNEAKEWHH